MQKFKFRDRLSASIKGAIVPFLPQTAGPGTNFLQLANLFGKQDPTPIDSASDAYERYLGWVRAAVSMIAFDVRSTPFTIYDRRGSTDREDWVPLSVREYHPALVRPNLKMTFQDLLEINQISMDLTGEGFWHLIGTGSEVDGIQFLSTEWIEDYIPDKNHTRIEAWKVMVDHTAEGHRRIPDEDIVQFKYPNPEDPVRGCSPLSAIATSQDIDTYVRSFVNGFFKGGGVPPVAIKTNQPSLTAAQRTRVVETWKERYAESSSDPGVLSKDSDIKIIGWPLKDLDLEMLTRFTREQILAIYGIPAAKFGIKDQGGLSDDTEGYEYSYQKNCLRPRVLRDQEEINLSVIPRLYPDRDIFFEFTDPVQEDVRLLKERANEMLEHGAITVNQYLGMMGEEAVADGDVYLIPSTSIRVPAGELKLIPEVQQLQMRLDQAEQKGLKLTQITGTYRMQLAQLEFLRSQDAQERSYKSKLRGLFSREQKMVLSAFDQEFNRKDFDPSRIESELKFVGPYLEDGKLMPGKFIKAYEFAGGIIEQTNVDAWTHEEVIAVRAGLTSGVDLVADEIGQAAVLSTADLAQRANTLAGQRVDLILNESYQVVNDIVDKGLKAGASTEDIRQAILGKYDNWKGYRAEAIARTETANAVNTGKFWGADTMAKEYSLKLKKQWVSTIDGNTRHSHLLANKQKRDMDEPFDVGSTELMNPGEYGGAPEETINCRCTVTFSVLD